MDKISLKAARVNANMSQDELAEKIGVTRRSVSAWENGRAKVSKRTLLAICGILGIDTDDIFLPEDFTKRTV